MNVFRLSFVFFFFFPLLLLGIEVLNAKLVLEFKVSNKIIGWHFIQSNYFSAVERQAAYIHLIY